MEAPGTVTTIGSLPHVDPDAAAAFALSAPTGGGVPVIPAAPSLPRRHPHEGMLAQAAWGVAGVEVAPDGSLALVGSGPDPDSVVASVDLRDQPWRGLAAFLDAATRSADLAVVKLQLTGPVTFGLALTAAGVPRHRALASALHAVRARVRDLVEIAAVRLPAARIVVFFDEPSLGRAGYGGGERSSGAVLGRAAAVDLLTTACRAAGPAVTTGIHCCDEADWAVALDAEPDILSLPVELAGRLRPGDVRGHLERGGWVAWGVVPTSGPRGHSAERLWHRLAERWHDLVAGGCDPVLVRTRAMVTPACGLAAHTEQQAAEVMQLVAELGARVAAGAVTAPG